MKTKVMVFGTFDGVHEGHLNFFKQAKKLAKEVFLVVSVARDKNVFKIKGKYPEKTEKQRKSLVKKSLLVDKAILAGDENYSAHIIKEAPDIIALGYDQKAYVRNLRKDLKTLSEKTNKKSLIKIIRLKPFKEKIYKNHLLKKRKLL